MWLAIIVALAFFAGALSNVVAAPPDWPDAIVGTVIAVALVAVPLFYRRERAADQRFITWLLANEAGIHTRRGSWYRGMLVTSETTLTRYRAVFSLLVVTYTVRSRFYLVGREPGRRAALGHSLATVLCGWWAVPWGLIRPLEALSVNAHGGDTLTVSELLRSIPGTAAPAVDALSSARSALPTPGKS